MAKSKPRKPAVKKPSKTAKPKAKKKRLAAKTEHGTHKLTRPQLQKWRMLDAELRAAAAQVEKLEAQVMPLRMALQQAIEKHPEVKKINDRIVVLINGIQEARKEFKARRDEHFKYVNHLGKLLDLDMSQCTIEPSTGDLRVIPEEK